MNFLSQYPKMKQEDELKTDDVVKLLSEAHIALSYIIIQDMNTMMNSSDSMFRVSLLQSNLIYNLSSFSSRSENKKLSPHEKSVVFHLFDDVYSLLSGIVSETYEWIDNVDGDGRTDTVLWIETLESAFDTIQYRKRKMVDEQEKPLSDDIVRQLSPDDTIDEEIELDFSLMDLDKKTVSDMEESWVSLIEGFDDEQ